MEPLSRNDDYKRITRFVFVLVMFVLVMFVGYQLYLSRHFRVTNTSPKTSNIAAVSPFLKINFNRQLSPKGLSLSSSYSVIKSYRIDGKTLVVNLKTPMTASYSYYVKINNVHDVGGEKLTNKVFLFTPKNIAYQKLSKDQQSALLQAQANRPHTVGDITFAGIDTLVSYGVSNTQATSLRQDFFNFSPKAQKISIRNAAPVPHDRNSASTNSTINFTVKIDSQTYAGRIDYSLLSDYLRLYLSDSNGTTVFDSGAVAPGGE